MEPRCCKQQANGLPGSGHWLERLQRSRYVLLPREAEPDPLWAEHERLSNVAAQRRLGFWLERLNLGGEPPSSDCGCWPIATMPRSIPCGQLPAHARSVDGSCSTCPNGNCWSGWSTEEVAFAQDSALRRLASRQGFRQPGGKAGPQPKQALRTCLEGLINLALQRGWCHHHWR